MPRGDNNKNKKKIGGGGSTSGAGGSASGKKKGHSPAHQNTFAFTHNPKSKKTQKILESPNIHVCRRCHDKIEWRKQYRKYKPRTQPGKCNICQKRNVLMAYHTICESCTIHSTKAKEIIGEVQTQEQHAHPTTTVETEDRKTISSSPEEEEKQEQGQEKPEDKEQPPPSSTSKAAAIVSMTKISGKRRRACASCVKEIALPDPDDEEDESLLDSLGRMRLRERKTLERQLAKQEEEQKKKKTNDGDDDNEEENEQAPQDANNTILEEHENNDDSEEDEKDFSDLDGDEQEDDPFLQAIGGADQLLTGEAYQKKLLELQAEKQSSTPAVVL